MENIRDTDSSANPKLIAVRLVSGSKKLESAGVKTMIHYPIPPHLQPAYAELGYARGAFPISENIHNTILSLPMSPFLNMDQIHFVISECLDD